jgi:hypothetical protein
LIDVAADTVTVGVVVGIVRANVADVAITVTVRIILIRIAGEGAVIYVTADFVAIGVIVGVGGAIVAGVADPVAVRVLLICIRLAKAVVDVAAHAVVIGIVIGIVRTFVTGVTGTVFIRVFLVGIAVLGTVVNVATDSVAIGIVLSIVGAAVAAVRLVVVVGIQVIVEAGTDILTVEYPVLIVILTSGQQRVLTHSIRTGVNGTGISVVTVLAAQAFHACPRPLIAEQARLAWRRSGDAGTVHTGLGTGAEQPIPARVSVIGHVHTAARLASIIRAGIAVVAEGVVRGIDALSGGVVTGISGAGNAVAAGDRRVSATGDRVTYVNRA